MAYYSKDKNGNPRKGRNVDDLLDKIAESKIENGTISIGGESITPITEHQDISGKANVGDSYTKQESDEKYATKQEIPDVSDFVEASDLASVATSGSYNDLSDKPEIQQQVQSDWNQSDSSESDYIKNKPTIPTVPTNVSAFNNDAGYLTQHQDISGKEDKSNKVTTISGNESSNTYYPTTKAVADFVSGVVGSINTILDEINGEVI